MKVELDKAFPMPGPADVAWALLQDVEAVASCMPGAKITERLPSGNYKGTVSVKVGPAAMSFRGEIEVRDIDAAQRSLRLIGKGTDSTGTSGASMDLGARIEAAGDGTSSLVGKSVVTMSGRAAGFGGRMMDSVADQVLKQFAQNMAVQVAARAAAAAPPAPPGAGATSAAAGAASTSAPSRAESPGSAAPFSPPPPAKELDGLALLWAAFKDWVAGFFRRKSA
jgi:carbon monoxide dehydrogenase subunit G